jgi:hypothetical protein
MPKPKRRSTTLAFVTFDTQLTKAPFDPQSPYFLPPIPRAEALASGTTNSADMQATE